MTDTSAEAVERLAEHITRGPHEAWELVCAATLRALVAERDAALAREAKLREALADMLAGWRYVRKHHGDLYGVGWDRCEDAARAALAGIADAE